MKMDNYNKVEELYSRGFRCIRYENNDTGEFVAYFKNFEEEEIDSLFCANKKEIHKIKSFIDSH